MTRYVVDASVAIKWFVPEIHTGAALRLLRDGSVLLAPDLLLPEFGNILCKKVRRGEMAEKTARAALQAFSLVPLSVHPSASLLEGAFDIAQTTGTTVYDSLYVALAAVEGCPLVTADRKLFDAHQGGPFEESLFWVEDL